MMRWLKDKKKEKKTNSATEDDDGKEDDYGFDKDKQSPKSPLTRRQLPLPPAVPEEKSPHIYEEIPDLYCLLDGGKTVVSGKGKLASRPSKSVPGQSSSYNVPSAEKSGDDINPYMVVAVDGEVRQTPTNFHRNGTPEVHCDVIVKDTHCEILLTRKPKVSAFRLDDAATSTGGCGGESSSGRYGLRNNTHFCSRDRRASVEVNSAGKLSSGFSASSSSAFSSSSRLPASAQSASNFSDLQPFESIQENDCSATNASNGVVTYSTGGNFIARATKLTFHPLGGKNPRKEAFGSDSSDDMQAAAYPAIRDENSSACTQGVSYASVQEIGAPSKATTYASLLDQKNSFACNAITPKTTAENQNGDWLSQQSTYRQTEIEKSFSANQNDFCVSSSEENFQIRTGVIRSSSPSYSSSCTYASVNFPTEAKVYNTIPDLNPIGYTDNSRKNSNSGKEESSSFHCRYNRETNVHSKEQYCDKRTNSTYSDIDIFGKSEPHNNHNSRLSENRGDSIFKHQKTLYRSDLTLAKNQTYASIDCDSNASKCSLFQMSQIRSRRSLDLDFCSCSDEHSSSCGCTDVKTDIDEDRSSVAGAAAAEGPNSCKGCGRIIRQITYSESFSDETSEHVYASRLLIRTGRRFSSPDITILESVNSEFQTRPHSRSPESLLSRDGTWAISKSDDTLPPAYGACDDNGFVSSYSEVRSLRRRDSDISSGRSPFRQPKSSDGPCGQINPKLYIRQNTCPADNHSSMFCDTRDTIRNSSIFSAGRISRGEYNHKVDTEIKVNAGPVIENQSRIITDSNKIFKNVECDKERLAETQKTTPEFAEPKPNTFSGIFSKFTRQRVNKPTKADSPENSVENPQSPRNMFDEEKCIDGNLQTELDTQETNVKRFSKFFQRISSKESTKTLSDNTIPKKVGFDTDSVEHAVIKNAFMIQQESSPQLACECPNQLLKELKNSPSGQAHPVQPSHKTHCFSLAAENSVGGHDGASKISDQTSGPCTNMFDLACQSVGLAGNKTDSGDTCYEYDISTSSEGEQAGYDYVLSKVEKTLNLEQEFQRFADGGASRRKLLCKRCERDENYSKIDSIEEGASGSSYGFCPHLSAKYGDLRAIFADLKDHRAAILDCLTDYAHSPYQLKGNNHENHCRECGCEVITSDSESLTTLHSLLSQQLALTSPNARTPSLESDEGTMADNSCESADETNVENNLAHVKHVDQDERNSSGYDEPDPSRVERASVKPRKRDKKDKKNSTAYSITSASTIEDDKIKVKLSQDTGTLTSEDGTRHGRLSFDSALLKQNLCNVNESLGGNAQKTKPKKTGVSPQNYQSLETKGSSEKELNHSKICPVSRRRPGLISDKALQDIYAPLPSKALCLITSRNYGPNTGGPCTCGRENQSPSAIMASLTATADPPPPPTVTVKENDTVKPSPCPPRLDPNNGDGVPGVQTHSEHKNSGKIASVEFNFYKRGNQLDSGPGERWKMDPDNKATVKGAVESTWMINSPAGNKGAHSPTKYGEAVSDNSITPHLVLRKHSRDTVRFEVTDRCAGDNRDTVAQRGRNIKRETGDKDDQAPQLMGTGTRETADPSTLSLVGDVGKKIKLTRRHRLELASLDLLPETALCGDADNEVGVTLQNNALAVNKIKKSSVVEKMTKIFEERALRKEEVTLLHRRKNIDDLKSDDSEIRRNRSRSRELSGIYRDSSNTHGDMRINSRESRSTHRDSSSTHRDSSSTHRNSRSNKRDSSSTHRDSNSTHRDSSSTHRDSNTTPKDSGSTHRDSSNTHRDSSTTHRDSSSNHRDSGSTHRDSSSTNRDSSTTHRDSSSTHRDSSSTHRDSSSTHRHSGSTGRKSGSTPRESSGTRRESKTNVDDPCIVFSHIKENLKPTPEVSTKKKPFVGALSAAQRKLNDILESAKLNETSTDAHTDGTRLKLKSKEGKTLNGQTVKYRSSSLNVSAASGRKVKSPTPSLSSSSTVSSSSSLTKRKGNGRQKKLHKKSSDKKRSKASRTDSGKAGERTRYYFSSDLSDIDVVEVDDWETYAKKLAPSNKNNLRGADSPQSSSVYGAGTNNERVGDVVSSSPRNRETPEAEHERYEQEIYALPPSSSELRNAREQSGKTTTSPQGSPELPKPRKAKRTDVYKTKKSSNQLLSDLIIRNYDMQVYGNV